MPLVTRELTWSWVQNVNYIALHHRNVLLVPTHIGEARSEVYRMLSRVIPREDGDPVTTEQKTLVANKRLRKVDKFAQLNYSKKRKRTSSEVEEYFRSHDLLSP